jgi:hypothetical protein
MDGFRGSTLLVLTGAVVAGGAAIALGGGTGATAAPDALLPAGARVVRLTVDLGVRVRLERDDRGWRLREPFEGRADRGVVDAMVASLETARAIRSVESDVRSPDPRFGLSPPRGRVVVGLEDGGDVTVEIGGPAPGEDRFYLRSSVRPRRVLVAAGSVLRSFERSPESLRDRRLWSIDPGELSVVEVVDGSAGWRLERTPGGVRVTPPGVAADPVRADRVFGLLSEPRAVADRPDGGCPAGPVRSVSVEGFGGERHRVVFESGEGEVGGCVDGEARGVRLSGEFWSLLSAWGAGLAFAPLFGLFDGHEVAGVDGRDAWGAWRVERVEGGWVVEPGGEAPGAPEVDRWLRSLALLRVDGSPAPGGPFEVRGSLSLRLRDGRSFGVEAGASGPDGSVRVRRAGEAAVFVLSPAQAHPVASARSYLAAVSAAGCDPAVVVSVEVVSARLPWSARRDDVSGWALEGTRLRADAAALDLLVGDLCRLGVAPRVAAGAVGSGERFRVVLRDRSGGRVLAAEVGGGVAGTRGYAAVPEGDGDARVLSEAAFGRLAAPPAAFDALASAGGGELRLRIDCGGGAGGEWRRPAGGEWDGGAAVSAAASVLSALSIRSIRAFGVASDPGEAWSWGCMLERSAGPAGSGPVRVGVDGTGAAVAWVRDERVLVELDPAVAAAAALLVREASTPGRPSS